MIYTENNVFDEALERIRMLFDTHEDVIICMSGGKDSTVMFEMSLMVAREKKRLPLKVFWLDQEAEWQGTVDYMDEVMHRPEVDPYWFQIPFDFTNSLSAQKNFLKVFDESCPEKWIHPKSEISIKENKTKFNRYHDLVKNLPTVITDKQCAVLVGMRMSESPRRRMSIVSTDAKWHGITWCTNPIGNTRKFWPIYDFTDDDIWTAIAKNHWKYNRVYDEFYRWGVSKKLMRISALIHETAWTAVERLQEIEPKTYNRFVARVAGISTFSHTWDSKGGDIIPKELPFMFSGWKEYRDYLLLHITKREYWDLFRKRWEGQDGDDWYKIHVKEVIINDIDGTVNQNHAYEVNTKTRLVKYINKHKEEFREYMKDKDDEEIS